jgi:hypothetical protein
MADEFHRRFGLRLSLRHCLFTYSLSIYLAANTEQAFRKFYDRHRNGINIFFCGMLALPVARHSEFFCVTAPLTEIVFLFSQKVYLFLDRKL